MAFKVNAGKLGSYETVVISDDEYDHKFVFVPDVGALPVHTKFFGHIFTEPIQSEETLVNNHWFRNFWLMPFPNRIADGSYRFKGTNYQLNKSVHDSRHALHGFFYQLWAEDIALDNRENEILLTIDHQYHADQVGFPFPFDTTITYRITTAGLFETTIEVTNTGDGKMPFGIGWHPYFVLDQKLTQLKVDVGALNHVELDGKQIPTGNEKRMSNTAQLTQMNLDDCFRYAETPYQLILSSDRYQLKVTQDNQFQFLQIFTPPDRASIAIEPMTCGVNALNTKDGLIELNPGETRRFQIAVEFSKL